MSRENWTTEKIYSRLLNNKSRKTYWDNIRVLQKRANTEVLTKSFELIDSEIAKERIIGIDIIAQLGSRPRPFAKEVMKIYFELLEKENNNKVLQAVLCGIGHNNEKLTKGQVLKIVTFKESRSRGIRQFLVHALLGVDDENAIGTLVTLMEDKVSSIRNWATFGIGTQLETNNKEILTALWARVNDEDQETKFEAIAGLAHRKAEGIKKVIETELKTKTLGALLFEAIETLNDKAFLPLLESMLNEGNEETNKEWLNALKMCIKHLKYEGDLDFRPMGQKH